MFDTISSKRKKQRRRRVGMFWSLSAVAIVLAVTFTSVIYNFVLH